MEKRVSFVSKVFKAKTRTKDGKDYFTFRINIPKEECEQLALSKEDYLFLSAMKAKWYQLVNWNEMSITWRMLPQQIKNEITQSGIKTPIEVESRLQSIGSPTHFSPSLLEQPQLMNITGLTNTGQ
jgi:hypothetical protein